MNKGRDYIKAILFQIKWAFMSREAKYAYLWNRTLSSEYALRRRRY